VEVSPLATSKQTSQKGAPKESTLPSTAKVIGTASGKIASLTGATPEAPPAAKSINKGRLAPKHKSRLPRRQKKTQRKAQASR
jgi:hypothetical protein